MTSYRDLVRRTATVQKTAQGAPAYSRLVNRALGRRAAALAYLLGLTPNQVTAISAGFTFTGIALVATLQPTVAVGALVAALLVIGYALDSADGQLARLRGGGSAAGEWFDHVVDAAKTYALHAAILICMYRHFELSTDLALLVPLCFGGVSIVWFIAFLLTELLRRLRPATGTPAGATDGPSGPAPWLPSLLKLPSDYGVMCLSFLLLGWPGAFFVLYTALFVGNLVYLPVALARSYRSLA